MQVLGQCSFCDLSWGIVFIVKTEGKHLVQEFLAILSKIILLMSATEIPFFLSGHLSLKSRLECFIWEEVIVGPLRKCTVFKTERECWRDNSV